MWTRKEFLAHEAQAASNAIQRETLACVADEIDRYGFCPPRRFETIERHRTSAEIAAPSWDFTNGSIRPLNDAAMLTITRNLIGTHVG